MMTDETNDLGNCAICNQPFGDGDTFFHNTFTNITVHRDCEVLKKEREQEKLPSAMPWGPAYWRGNK